MSRNALEDDFYFSCVFSLHFSFLFLYLIYIYILLASKTICKLYSSRSNKDSLLSDQSLFGIETKAEVESVVIQMNANVKYA